MHTLMLHHYLSIYLAFIPSVAVIFARYCSIGLMQEYELLNEHTTNFIYITSGHLTALFLRMLTEKCHCDPVLRQYHFTNKST